MKRKHTATGIKLMETIEDYAGFAVKASYFIIHNKVLTSGEARRVEGQRKFTRPQVKKKKSWTVGWEEACKQRLPILGLQDGNFLSAGSHLQRGPCTASFRGNEDRSRQVSSWFKNKILEHCIVAFLSNEKHNPTTPYLPKTKQKPPKNKTNSDIPGCGQDGETDAS